MRSLITAAALAISSAQAWSINGHLLVANIAQKLLEENAPDALQTALDTLSALQESDPDLVYREVDHPFVETATFADDIKYHGGGWQSDYHFKDIPWIEEGSSDDYDLPNKSRVITGAIENITNWLSEGKNGDEYKEDYIYDYIQNRLYPGDEANAKSYALRLLIHYLGDVVQPFHCEDRFNSSYAEGDTGANDFPLPNHYDVDELHALWDKVLYDQRYNIARPISEEDWTDLQSQVANIMSTYAYVVADSSIYENQNYDDWAEESYEIAITLYDGITENEEVPQEYLDKNTPLAYERIILGGHRLAYLIEFMFGDATFSATKAEEANSAAAFLQ